VDADDWSKVVLAAIPVVGAVAKQLRGTVQGRRGRLVSDAELLAKLPPDSAAYTRMLGHLDEEVAHVIEDEDRKRRDDVAPFLWAAAAVVAFLGTVGLVQDATPRARDDAGRPIT
jgi:hypothetical protein